MPLVLAGAPEQAGSHASGAHRGWDWADAAFPGLAASTAPYAPVGAALPGAPPAEGAVARDIARQIAAQPGLAAEGTAELRLAPEALGPLRLSVERGEDGLRLVIEAARPETADLLRRHLEALRQELRQEGLGSVGVSIGGGEARREGGTAPDRPWGEPDPRASPARGAPEAAPALGAAPTRPGRGAGGHLDIRF